MTQDYALSIVQETKKTDTFVCPLCNLRCGYDISSIKLCCECNCVPKQNESNCLPILQEVSL